MRKKSVGRIVFKIVNTSALTVFALICILPFWHLLMSSLSDINELAQYDGFVLWPRCGEGAIVDFSGYKSLVYRSPDDVYHNPLFLISLANSVFYIVAGGMLSIILAYCAAYCVRRNGLWSKHFAVMMVLASVFNAGIIPSYAVHKSIGLVNNRWVVIMIGLLNIYYVVYVLNSMKQIPRELEDAADIDGAGAVYVLVKIIFPLTKAAAAAVLLACVVSRWNDFIYVLTYLTRRESYNIQMYIYGSVVQSWACELDLRSAAEMMAINKNQMCARVIAMLLPVVLTYPLVTKWIRRDIMIGPIKG